MNLGRPRWIKLHQSKAWILPSQWDSRALSEKENPQSLTPNTNPWLTNQLFKIIFFAYDRTMVFVLHQSSIVIQPTFFLFASLFDWMGACKLNYLCILSEFCFLVGLRYAWSLVYFAEWHFCYSWELKLRDRNGRVKYCTGHQSFPRKFKDLIKELDILFGTNIDI